MNADHLLNVVRACRESNRPTFTMRQIMHPCGTPACALGEYAARSDLQDVCALGQDIMRVALTGGRPYDMEVLLEHFDVSREQFDELFDWDGCGGATTALAAASYIERFVEANRDDDARRSQ